MNIDLLFFLFNDFVGGADDDELINEFGDLNLDDHFSRQSFINQYLVPRYKNVFSASQKNELLSVLRELLNSNFDISDKVNSQLFPFEFPQNPYHFINEIYIVLSGIDF